MQVRYVFLVPLPLLPKAIRSREESLDQLPNRVRGFRESDPFDTITKEAA